MADKRKWRTEPCPGCSGFGVVARYTLGGSDFDGPEECEDCNGSGVQWVHRRTGTIAQYPGGPLMGRHAAKGEK